MAADDERIAKELDLLRMRFPDLEYRSDGRWVLLPAYQVPGSLWDQAVVATAFQIPQGYPGQKPYGFYVRPRVNLRTGEQINNYTDSAEPPFSGEWRKFSWDVPEWSATNDLRTGSNLLNYVLTFTERFKEGA